jgi:SAM-dependent methyltransferase
MGALTGAAASLIARSDAPLPKRYADDAVRVFDREERRRFLDDRGRARDEDALRWELLYRLEPELYARLVAGEPLHDGILDWLPRQCASVLEVGAGAGRLTVHLAGRAGRVTAVEPAEPLRRILRERLAAVRADNVEVTNGFFDDLPGSHAHGMVISCSAFNVRALADPEGCLRRMESACAPGGCVVLVWPADVAWLGERGFEHVVFEGPMVVEYSSTEEAASLARIFYPDVAPTVADSGSRFVDFATLCVNAPRDLCWKRIV